jgi:hypothetical protein
MLMNLATGRTQALSPFHRYLADLAEQARLIPRSTVQRTMDVAGVAAARMAAGPRPSWAALFTKALAFVAGQQPELRQSWQTWPRPHLYEHPVAVPAIAVERPLDEELPGFWATIAAPDQMSLVQLDGQLKRCREEPAQNVAQVRHWQRHGSRSALLRRLGWWLDASLSGRRRAERLGTCAIASVGSLGTDISDPLYPTAVVLTYGPISAQGIGEVRLTFDARLLTCAGAARVLGELERALTCEMLMELRYFRRLDAA